MGFIFLFFWIALAFDVLGLLAAYAGAELYWHSGAMPFTYSSVFYAATALALGATVYGYFEARAIRVERIHLRTAKLPAAFGRVKIIQISDVHLGALIGARRLHRPARRGRDARECAHNRRRGRSGREMDGGAR